MQTIGDRIRLARERCGLSKSELGNRVGVSPVAVGKWESGASKNLRLDNFLKLSQVLGVDDLVWLIKGGEAEPAFSAPGQSPDLEPTIVADALQWIDDNWKKRFSGMTVMERAEVFCDLYHLFSDESAATLQPGTVKRLAEVAEQKAKYKQRS
ncbi:MAG: helix-turn-helix domain-containing protein [Pseudomonadota bacterium]